MVLDFISNSKVSFKNVDVASYIFFIWSNIFNGSLSYSG